MKIGDLKNRVEIQIRNKVIDSDGFEEESWTKLKTCWASIKDKTRTTTNFIVRHDKIIENYDTRELAILYKNKRYNINYTDNVNMEKNYLLIVAEVINNGS